MSAASQNSPWWKRTIDFWLRREPILHARWEIVLMRFVVAILLWDVHTGWIGNWDQPVEAVKQIVTLDRQNDIKFQSQPHPNGLGYFVDFSFLSNDSIETPLRAATGISLLLYFLGVPAAFSLAIPVFFGIGSSTLLNSQGAIGHIGQGLHLVMLSIWLAGLVSLFCRIKKQSLPGGLVTSGQLEMDWARQGLMAAYVVSAITKIMNSSGDWLSTARFFPLHLVKNNDMQFYNNLDPAMRELDWLPQVLMEHPMVCMFFFGAALPLELFAFLGLQNRRIAVLFGVGLIAFHESVTQLTHLSFIFNKLLLLFLFVNPIWWLVQGLRKICGFTFKVAE
jgi:hypothetical protein